MRISHMLYNQSQIAVSPYDDIHYMPSLSGEDSLANRIALELKALFQEGKLNCMWFHVPNEFIVHNKRDFATLKKKKCLGMIAGAPDFTFIKYKEPLTLLVELKTNTGKLSSKQKMFKAYAENNHIPYFIVKSWNELKTILTDQQFIGG